MNSLINMTVKEANIVQNILKRYDFEPISIEKIRSIYKINTGDNSYCLKKIRHGPHKIKNSSLFIEALALNNFNNTPSHIKTKKGAYYTKYKSYYFYCTRWIEGTECSFKDINNIINSVKLLANFHNCSKNISTNGLKLNYKYKNWNFKFKSYLNDFDKFQFSIESKRLKNAFDKLYLDYISSYYELGISALAALNRSDYNSLIKSDFAKLVCHDSFYYQNIIVNTNGYFLIDFNNIAIDLRISDLGKLIRRIMSRTEFSWDFNLALQMIEAYNSIYPLCISELEAMLALIIFPYSFWKLGKKRYVKSKPWAESKYLHKLNKILKGSKNQLEFLTSYENFILSMKEKNWLKIPFKLYWLKHVNEG